MYLDTDTTLKVSKILDTYFAVYMVAVRHVHRVSEKKTSTHIIGYKLRNSCLILIIFDIKISDII